MTGSALVLLAALLLDAAFGEPAWLWSRLSHPAVLMGRAVGWADWRFNTGAARRVKGTLVIAGFILAAAILGLAIETLLPTAAVDTLLVAILLAHRSLVQHVAAVATELRKGVLQGRKAVSMIVGRDTADMDTSATSRAAIESAAENLSDGVVAPAFWFLIGGLPGILVYKITNTADSMIGYRTERHEAFGWAAARSDDLLNWIPARLTAALILLSHGRLDGWVAVASEARKHRSPNAGWPEAAMARCLDVALSGPRSYDGKMRDFPFVHPDGNRFPTDTDIDAAVSALWRSWALMSLIVGMVIVVAN